MKLIMKMMILCLFSFIFAIEDKHPCIDPYIEMGVIKSGRIITWQYPWTSGSWYRKLYLRNPSYGQWREAKGIWSTRHVYIDDMFYLGWEYKIILCEKRTSYE